MFQSLRYSNSRSQPIFVRTSASIWDVSTQMTWFPTSLIISLTWATRILTLLSEGCPASLFCWWCSQGSLHLWKRRLSSLQTQSPKSEEIHPGASPHVVVRPGSPQLHTQWGRHWLASAANVLVIELEFVSSTRIWTGIVLLESPVRPNQPRSHTVIFGLPRLAKLESAHTKYDIWMKATSIILLIGLQTIVKNPQVVFFGESWWETSSCSSPLFFPYLEGTGLRVPNQWPFCQQGSWPAGQGWCWCRQKPGMAQSWWRRCNASRRLSSKSLLLETLAMLVDRGEGLGNTLILELIERQPAQHRLDAFIIRVVHIGIAVVFILIVTVIAIVISLSLEGLVILSLIGFLFIINRSRKNLLRSSMSLPRPLWTMLYRPPPPRAASR